jgi:thioesterase domain-containing protein
VERDLAAVWKDVLGVSSLSVTDNFFDLGGHSFLASVLMAQIRARLGHSLPLGMLFSAPTVEKLAAVLQQQLEAGTDGSLVPFREKGDRPPLFLIAGVGGHVFTFHKFARLLGDDQPVYGVKAIGVDGQCATPRRLEEIAAQYVQEILAVRPEGPYVLGGYSVGAVIALELALQLRAAGHTVEQLVVFDMVAPGYPQPLPITRRLLLHANNFLRLEAGQKRTYLFHRLVNVKRRLFQRMGLGVYNAPEIAGVQVLQQATLKKVWAALQTAHSHYVPRGRFDGRVVLFRSAQGPDWVGSVFDDPLMGWGRWTTQGVEAHTVPGGHLELFDDRHLGALTAQVREVMEESLVPGR